MNRNSLMVFSALAMLLALVACSRWRPGASPAAVELFNGRDLYGWAHVLEDPAVPRDVVWSVRDGFLVCAGTSLGVLHTERKFLNFRLMVEYRWAPGEPPGNNGILTRINGPARALPRCAEVQLKHGNAGDVLGLQGMKVAAGSPRFFEIKAHEIAGDVAGVRKLMDAEKPPGEWNRVEVLAQNDTYTVWMNGRQINRATGVEIIAGPVGLQSEGGAIHFRRVTLTPLPD